MPIHHADTAPPPGIPPGYVGHAVLPHSGRLVYWTGRVAIGLRHQAQPARQALSHSAALLQTALLPKARP